MKFTRETTSANTITRHDADSIAIGADTYRLSLIVSARTIVEDWDHPAVEEIDLASLQPALDVEPEVVLLGTGSRHRFPDRRLLAAMAERGIGFEVMETAAACRTYNVLVQEGRRVVAALIIG